MQNSIIEECISIIGTLCCVLIIRYTMELSTPQQDMYMLQWYYEEAISVWKRGNFESMMHWYRAKKLLDYD